MIKIGLIGKTNTGKTTFFNSATLATADISNYPFTTKQPTIGNANAVTLCVHKELNLQDNPKNSRCIDGWRFIPVELVDLPGLIKGAWEGKGLGNKFLSVAAQSDALLHIVDVSGSIDAAGRIAEPGSGDPIADIGDIEEELVMWYLKLDRKSTRLNSSHANISYAVFCLKKKKTKAHADQRCFNHPITAYRQDTTWYTDALYMPDKMTE